MIYLSVRQNPLISSLNKEVRHGTTPHSVQNTSPSDRKGRCDCEKLAEILSMSEHLVGFHLIRLSQQGLVDCEGELALATGLARSLELKPTYPWQ